MNEEKKIDKRNVQLVEVTKDNYKTAVQIQKLIFASDNGEDDIKQSVGKIKNFDTLKYWLLAYEDKIIGICGLYSYIGYPKDAWLGWFGVVPEFRKNGVARRTLETMMQKAKENNFTCFRAYTDDIENANACKLYDKVFQIKEEYTSENGEYYKAGRTLIYSMSLNEKIVEPWNNRCIDLAGHEKNNACSE